MEERHEDRGVNGQVQVYRLKGPAWRPRLHPGSKAIGIPDINSHRPKQAEDDISENAVKNGFSVPMVVGNETFSAHDMIFDRLKATTLLPQLGSLFQEVILRRDDLTNHRSSAGPLQFRPPQRVTLNEIKLAAYVKELADPNISLKKLAKSVPHGYRGERMLDMLWNGGSLTPAMAAIKAQVSTPGSAPSSDVISRSVTIERSVWFIRVVGSSESSSSRARQGHSSSYTIEWTLVFMGWLRRQIVELNIIQNNVETSTGPASPKAVRMLAQARENIRPQFGGHFSLLLDEDYRQRWCSKWQYSLRLLRSLCHHSLVDPPTSVKVTLDMLRTANLAQITFLLAVTEELLECIFVNAALIHQAVDVLCAKMTDLRNLSSNAGYFQLSVVGEVQQMLSYILRRYPEALINPCRWKKHENVLKEVLLNCHFPERQVICFRERNEKLSLCLMEDDGNEQAALEGSDYERQQITILDRIALESTVDDAFTQIFKERKHNASDTLKTILTWSTTQARQGRHRPYAGAHLLYLYTQGKTIRRTGSHGKNVMSPLHKIDLGTFLFKWISEVETVLQEDTEKGGVTRPWNGENSAIKSIDVSQLIILMGEVIRLGVFSYSKYLQRLAARNTIPARIKEEKVSMGPLHAKIMRSVPLPDMSTSLEHQRRIAIYGNRTKESWEEATYRRAVKELSIAFPWQASQEEGDSIHWNADSQLPHFWSSSDFIRHRVIQSGLLPFFRQTNALASISDDTFANMIDLLAQSGDFVSLCEIILFVETNQAHCKASLLKICKDAIIANRLVWIGMNVPLLHHIGLDPFPLHDRREKTRQVEQLHLDGNLKSILRQSAASFLEGDESYSKDLLMNCTSAKTCSHETLAGAVLLAAFHTAQERSRETSTRGAIVAWIILALKSFQEGSQHFWDEPLLASLESLFSSEEGWSEWHLLADMLVDLVLEGLISPVDLVRRWMTPRMIQEADSTSTIIAGKGDLSACLLRVTSLLFKAPNGESSLRLASTQASMIVSSTVDDFLFLLRLVAAKEDRKNASEREEAIASICQNPVLQIHFQARLFDLCSFLGEKLKRGSLEKVISQLLQGESPLNRDNILDIDFAELIKGSTVWQEPALLFQLGILIQRLESVDIGLQNRSQAKIQSIARLTTSKWFKWSTIERCGMPLLLESRSSVFTTAVVEEILRIIHASLQTTLHDSASVPMDWIRCAKYVLQKRDQGQLPPMTIVTSLMSLVGEQIDTARDTFVVTMIEGEDASMPHLDCQLSVICLLLQLDNLWTAQSKAIAPQLAFALLRQSILSSSISSSNDGMANKILDVVSYLFQEMPVDLLQSIQSSADGIVDLIRQLLPGDQIRSRILLLLNRTDLNTASPPMVLASSISNAYTSGKYVIDKPWEYHTNIEALEHQHYRPTLNQASADGSQAKDDIDHTLMPLMNNGPISLEHFNAKMSRDRLIEDDIKIDSEMSYGLGLGGEPMYARDIRRDLLHLETDEEVKKQNRSLARIKESHAINTTTSAPQGTKTIKTTTPLGGTPSTPTKKRSKDEADPDATAKDDSLISKKKTKKR